MGTAPVWGEETSNKLPGQNRMDEKRRKSYTYCFKTRQAGEVVLRSVLKQLMKHLSPSTAPMRRGGGSCRSLSQKRPVSSVESLMPAVQSEPWSRRFISHAPTRPTMTGPKVQRPISDFDKKRLDEQML